MLRSFLDKIHNLSAITVISGNHDRTSVKTELDPKGGVAQLLAFMLDQSSKEIDVVWDPILVSKEIDGMQYVLTHNHLGVSKNDMSKLFWEYGSQGKYNLLIGGHWHSRRGKREYRKVDEVYWDQANYRAISVAPLFTGNFYSESSGWTSSSGITIIENNGAGKPNIYDITLV
jgi:calcineurin-like phosphoesterase family protein